MHLELLRIEQDAFHADRDGHLVDDRVVEIQDLIDVVVLPLGQAGDLVEPVLPYSYSAVELGVCEGFLGLESGVPSRGSG